MTPVVLKASLEIKKTGEKEVDNEKDKAEDISPVDKSSEKTAKPKIIPKKPRTGKISKKESRLIAEKNCKVTSWIKKSKAVTNKKADLIEVEDMEWLDIEINYAGLDWNDEEDTEKLFREVIVNEKREKWINWKWMKELVV